MIHQLEKYLTKIQRDGSCYPGRAAVFARDDQLLRVGCEDFRALGQDLLQRLDSVALVIGEPQLPVHHLYHCRLAPDTRQIVPLDTETRTFLHDIPLIRKRDGQIVAADIAEQLQRSKGVLVEGLGIIAVGSATVEQAYINFSTVHHALFVGYLLQLQREGFHGDEDKLLRPLLEQFCRPIPEELDDLFAGPFTDLIMAHRAIEQAGRRTVDLHLVDSFFGNISCRFHQQVLISQTGASLDALRGCIDPVTNDNTSTAGLTASSELPAHRAVYQAIDAAVILHGHPKFTVIMSLLCEESCCPVKDCWKDCPHVRYLDTVPIVAGEVGAGGIAKTLPPVMVNHIAVVYGHGVFAADRVDFRRPLQAMIALENWCRREYLRRLDHRSVL